MSPVQRGSAEAEIADRIKQLRAEMGMTQEDFADLISVTRNHVAHIETYRTAPSLSAVLGVLLMDLRVAGETVRPVDPTWLLLGPDFEKDMWGKVRHGLLDGRSMDDRWLLADWAQHGKPTHFE